VSEPKANQLPEAYSLWGLTSTLRKQREQKKCFASALSITTSPS